MKIIESILGIIILFILAVCAFGPILQEWYLKATKDDYEDWSKQL